MQKELMEKAMLAMGWNPASEIPMANEENTRILKELDALVEERGQLFETQQQTAERVEKLQQHAKNAETSINHNLKLLSAYQSQMRTEAHLFKLAEREHSKLKQDLKDMDKDLGTVKQHVENTEKELCKRKHHVDDMTNRIKWAKTVLIEWQQAMDDSYKGSQLLERYFKEDELRARQEDTKRQLLQDDIEKHRKELIELSDEQRALELTLECTANMYRSAHAERRQLVEMWKSAVSQMLQRERDIEQGEMELIDLKRESKRKAEEQRRQDDKLNELIDNNREVEAAIEELNSSTSDIKEQIQTLRNMIVLKENEVELLQKELQNLANRVQQQRMENRQNEKDKASKLLQLETSEEVIKKLEDRLKSMQEKNLSAQQRLQMLDDMSIAEEKALNQLNKETTRINGLIFRAEQQLVKLKNEEKVVEIGNEGIKVGIQAIQKNKQKTEKELRRQTEINYTMGFKCLQIERRNLKLQGGLIDPEVEQKNLAYLAELEEQQVKTMKRLQVTETENKKLDDNMRKVTICYNNDISKLELMHFKVKEAQSYCEGGLVRLKNEKHQSQVLIVELSLLKMRVNDFETEIAKCENSLYNLDKHRAQLNRTIKDRMVEIKSQMDLLHLKKKHLSEEKSTLNADIGERNKHIDAVRARFELTSPLLGTNEDGTFVTATQLKVELAQEKQMLLEEGDELNAKVLKAEEEIKAMENTLLLLNTSNDSYRRNFQQVKDGDETQAELTSLQNNYCKALNSLKELRSKILHIEQSNERAKKQKEQLERQLEIEAAKRMENSEVYAKLQKDIFDQKAKIQRAEREIKNVLKTLKQQDLTSEFMTLFERELDLRELEYRNTKALNQLSDMAENDDQIGPKIIRVLTDKGLKLPHFLQKSHSFATWRSDFSDMSLTSSRDVVNSTSRSSTTEGSQLRLKSSSTRVSVVSIDFAAGN